VLLLGVERGQISDAGVGSRGGWQQACPERARSAVDIARSDQRRERDQMFLEDALLPFDVRVKDLLSWVERQRPIRR
jgi:hypothetical protein